MTHLQKGMSSTHCISIVVYQRLIWSNRRPIRSDACMRACTRALASLRSSSCSRRPSSFPKSPPARGPGKVQKEEAQLSQFLLTPVIPMLNFFRVIPSMHFVFVFRMCAPGLRKPFVPYRSLWFQTCSFRKSIIREVRQLVRSLVRSCSQYYYGCWGRQGYAIQVEGLSKVGARELTQKN
jgi:hypothetical protein